MRVAVVADDLTGANVTATLLLRQGIRARVAAVPDAGLDDGVEEALLVNADSRSLDPAAAYRRVRETVQRLAPPGDRLLAKRLDSTGRGNLGAEIDAALDASGRRLCLAALADPENGKQTVDGRLLVGGRPVTETAAARDPVHPLRTAAVAELIAVQSRRPVVRLPGDLLRAGGAAAAGRLRELAGETAIVVCDCADSADLGRLADLALALAEPVVIADPGPLTAELARRLLRPPLPRPVFLVCGSVQENIPDQLAELQAGLATHLVEVPPGRSGEPDFQQAIAGWLERWAQGDTPAVIALCSGTQRVPVNDGGDRLVSDLANLAAGLIHKLPFTPAGLVLTGGQTAVAVCRALGITSLQVLGSVLPYAAVGLVRSGRWAGLPVVTKGGLIGDAAALRRCAEYIHGLWRDIR